MSRQARSKNTRLGAHAKYAQAVGIRDDNWLFEMVENTESPLLLFLDGIQDPHNFGACLRTADGAGVHAVIIPMKNQVGITPTVRMVASGAAETVPVVEVRNFFHIITRLKEMGVHFVGTSDRAKQSLYHVDMKKPLAIVLGSEGNGVRKLTAENCDELVKIPMLGDVECLNVSVSAGICLYEAIRQRKLY